jgi:dolichyl-phosphate-mannose-protein mannosyltransferase
LSTAQFPPVAAEMTAIQKTGNSANPDTDWLAVYLVAGTCVLFSIAWRLWILQVREFDQDEFEHFHVVWCISKGLVPYRDFFEHHTPWFYYLFAPLVRFFDVEDLVGDAVGFLFVGRRVMWFFLIVILVLTFWLGRLWRNSLVAIVGVLFLVNTAIFLDATLEFRPDLLSTIFWLATLIMFLQGTSKWQTKRRGNWSFALAGVFLASGVLTTQKLLLTFPGIAIGLVWYLRLSRNGRSIHEEVWPVLKMAAGFLVPVALTLGYFYAQGALWDFIHYNFLFNFGFKAKRLPYKELHALLIQHPYLMFCGVLTLSKFLFDAVKGKTSPQADCILFPCALSSIIGLWLIPAPFAHYYLIFLPLLSLFVADFVLDTARKLNSQCCHFMGRKWLRSIATGSLPLLVVLAAVCRPHVALYWYGALCLLVLLIFLRIQTATAVATFLVVISVPPQVRTYANLKLRNTAQLGQIRYVLQNTTSNDTVMDGFTGNGVFRPHAYFYYMLHYGVRWMLSEREWNGLLGDLRTGKIAPKLVILDEELRQLPDDIVTFFRSNYEPVGVGEIWRRRQLQRTSMLN